MKALQIAGVGIMALTLGGAAYANIMTYECPGSSTHNTSNIITLNQTALGPTCRSSLGVCFPSYSDAVNWKLTSVSGSDSDSVDLTQIPDGSIYAAFHSQTTDTLQCSGSYTYNNKNVSFTFTHSLGSEQSCYQLNGKNGVIHCISQSSAIKK